MPKSAAPDRAWLPAVLFDDAKVDEGHAAVGEDEQVASVHISMEPLVRKDAGDPRVQRDDQRELGLRCKPALLDGVQLTRTQMARLAQSEAPPQQHLLRASPHAP